MLKSMNAYEIAMMMSAKITWSYCFSLSLYIHDICIYVHAIIMLFYMIFIIILVTFPWLNRHTPSAMATIKDEITRLSKNVAHLATQLQHQARHSHGIPTAFPRHPHMEHIRALKNST